MARLAGDLDVSWPAVVCAVVNTSGYDHTDVNSLKSRAVVGGEKTYLKRTIPLLITLLHDVVLWN